MEFPTAQNNWIKIKDRRKQKEVTRVTQKNVRQERIDAKSQPCNSQTSPKQKSVLITTKATQEVTQPMTNEEPVPKRKSILKMKAQTNSNPNVNPSPSQTPDSFNVKYPPMLMNNSNRRDHSRFYGSNGGRSGYQRINTTNNPNSTNLLAYLNANLKNITKATKKTCL